MKSVTFSAHALEEMQRRGITQDQVQAVLLKPEQVLSGRNRRTIYQSRASFGSEKQYLLRVFVDETVKPLVVITVYRTSKIQKYWRMP
ncbi:DUF4258 domain-containing protein [Candidatus Synechococcus calcipolaris G9]|uniref:DUF4258 domain-containing protein n=1 Tax=Candidatus Synechococcus calcipolaris G9 TaxID=1497997 RepID=A0ABT6F164_9SYNE|nr:DUF4258 domain-containing protein [Candidatus Synechococcus calcipolaris]MDG2991565.1 DUF4258 domain-containing protein [Candidatus Synechococcus calcipolaris G9]